MSFFRLLAFVTLVSSSGFAQVAVNGVADLSQTDFSDKQPIYLSGSWEFYWNRLLTPADFKINQNPASISIPGAWNYRTDYPALGFATYRLKLVLPSDQRGLSIFIPIVNAAGKVWLNGEVAGGTGVIHSDRKKYHPQLSSMIVSVPEKTDTVEVVIQAENYTYYNAGIGRSPQLGTAGAFFKQLSTSNGLENFFSGCLVAMWLYQLILFFIYQRGKPHLWLSMICLGVALRAMIVHGGSFLLPDLFPSVEWETWKKIEFGSVYGSMAFFPLYVYYLFEKHAPRKPMLAFATVSTVMLLIVLFTPQYTYGAFLEVVHIGLILGFAYAVYSIGKAWRAGEEDARVILFGLLTAFPFILAEILKNTSIVPVQIEFPYLVEIGVLIFLVFQIYLLANHHANSYKSLLTLNENLEKVISERTSELVTTNAVKDRLLSVVSHDIRSPLNNLHGILQVYNSGAMNQDELGKYTVQIEDDLSKTSMLMDNILFWTANQLEGVNVRIEKFDLKALVDENVDLFHGTATRKGVKLINNLPGKFEIKSDKNILKLLLRNLLANAVKFSFDGGAVKINAERNGQYVMFKVQDEGTGMDEATLRALFSTGTSTPGTSNEDGTGLGLALCRDYLQRAGGSLSVDSLKGKGTTFSINLPL